jgi:hypothetical protein
MKMNQLEPVNLVIIPVENVPDLEIMNVSGVIPIGSY